MNLTKLAHQLIDEYFSNKEIDIAIDATCGNGNDSLFLAKRSKQLLCFDIQEQAINNTQLLLSSHPLDCAIQLIQDSHAKLAEVCDQKNMRGQVDVVMFNLGFLPKSDDLTITTTKNSTSAAIKHAIECLSSHAMMTLLCYRGHDNGAAEFQAVQELIQKLSSDAWQCQQFDSAKATETTPILLTLSRKLC